MKRLLQIAKELNVGFSTIQRYLDTIGYLASSPNEKISPDTEDKIIKIHAGRYIPAQEQHISQDNELPEEFNSENLFEPAQVKMISTEDQFSDRKPFEKEIEGDTIQTIFTDFEAFSICQGIEDRHAKYIARQYFKTEHPPNENTLEAHAIAMNTLERYGGTLMSYFLTLPPLPFKALNATQIFRIMDKQRKLQDFPILRIAYTNDKGEKEKIQIAFYAEKSSEGRRRMDNVIVAKNKTTGKTLMKIARNGKVIVEASAKQIIPILQLFIRFSQNTRQYLINYGLETGECAKCGRELTVKESIERGIGPICIQQID